MAILVTAGTGKSSKHLEKLLQQENIPFILTSRRGAAAAPVGLADRTVKFDMLDKSTYANAFEYKLVNGKKLTAMYLITPETEHPLQYLDAFIEFAVDHGIQRVIMMAGSIAEVTPEWVEQTWRYLSSLQVEFRVLRPTWFSGM